MLVKTSTTAAQSFLACFEGEVFGMYSEELLLLYIPMEDDDDAVWGLFDEDIQLVRSSWPLPQGDDIVVTTIQVAIPQQEEE